MKRIHRHDQPGGLTKLECDCDNPPTNDEQKAAPPRASDTTVHTIHEVRCRDTGGRGVRLVVTDNIAVVKIALKSAELEAAEMSIDFRDVLALNDTLLRGSQALTGLTPIEPPIRPGLAGSFPGAVDNDGSHFDAYWKGRRDEAEQNHQMLQMEHRPVMVTHEQWRRPHWWWPFGERQRWTRSIG